MDLLDRYMAAVAALLPKAERQDIIAELRDLLLSQMEEKEAQLGRPLTSGGREEVLRAFGHPIAVAGRFGTPRSVIGPELYPFYMFAVKGLLILSAAVTAIPIVIAMFTGDEGAAAPARFLSDFLTTAMMMIGAATVVGMAIERGWIRLGRTLDWKVADLPRLDRRGGKVRSRFKASFELAATLLFILWWTGAVEAPWSASTARNGVFLSGAPIWSTLYLPILGLALVQVASSLVAMIRPDWVRARAGLEIAGALGGLAMAATLWSAGRLVEVTAQGATGPRSADIAALQLVIGQMFQIGTAVAAAICVVKLIVEIWRLFRGARAREAAA
ncbi:HAAS signaling domain-containing protein [Caulobacter sp. LARHSG274]